MNKKKYQSNVNIEITNYFLYIDSCENGDKYNSAEHMYSSSRQLTQVSNSNGKNIKKDLNMHKAFLKWALHCIQKHPKS